MNNELALNNMNVLESMTKEELDILQTKIMDRKMKMITKELAEVKNEQAKLKEEFQIEKEETKNLRELELKRHRTTEHRFGYVGLNDLGQCYQVSIGSKTMGKLLRLAGLAKAKQSKTEPMRSATLNNFAKSVMYGEYPTYKWNPEKCIEKIDRWLDKEDIIDDFYAIEDETELMRYINNLATKNNI